MKKLSGFIGWFWKKKVNDRDNSWRRDVKRQDEEENDLSE